jgi:hypothetical protein
VRFVILGEAPPPEKFFYFGDSLFFQYLRRAFIPLVPQVEEHSPEWFLALYRNLGGWRTDVCDEPIRATKGGADDVSPCMAAFGERWKTLNLTSDAFVIVSPKRLTPLLPDAAREKVVVSVPPPGQWNAHRQTFLREVSRAMERYVGRETLQRAAESVYADEAALEFEAVRACAPASWTPARRSDLGRVGKGNLICGSPPMS